MSHVEEYEHLRIKLVALKSATNNFADENRIGYGGFGKVYNGKISFFGGHIVVALKRLNRVFGQGDPEFWKEIMMLSQYKHKNIVSLIGYCDDHGEKILVYEYVPNKSLDRYLKSDKLTWITRLKICIGAARGLAYLHRAVGTKKRVLHRDIKSSNILLDEDMNAKISDFGLSKFGPANQEFSYLFSNAKGTPGYCDPLYARYGYLTKESDVYSFGIVLFEVLCGRLCIDRNVNISLLELVGKSYNKNSMNEIVFGKIKDEINPESLRVFVKIAYQCLKTNREERPLISDVVNELVNALRHQGLKSDEDASNYLLPEPSDVMESDHVASSYLPREPSEVMESDHVESSYLPREPSKVIESDHVASSYLPSKTTKVMESHNGKDAQPSGINEYASEGGGFLVVTIHQGNYLSKMKTYVILRVGSYIGRTKKIKSQNPIWNEKIKFTLEKPAKEILHLALFADPPWYRDYNLKENLGDVYINIGEVVKEKHINKVYAFGNCKILVELQWVPSA